MFGMELAYQSSIAGDQRIRYKRREVGGKQLLIKVPQALRFIYYQCACTLSQVKNMRSIQKLTVERRILTHQDNVKFTEQILLFFAKGIEILRLVSHSHRVTNGFRHAIVNVEIFEFEVNNCRTAMLGL